MAAIYAENIFQALSDLTRIRIMRLFTQTGEEMCLCELVDSLLEPEYKLSRHVKILKTSGLLTSQKQGRWVYHRLRTGTPYLNSMHETVKLLPDKSGVFKRDLANFKKRKRLRVKGRCEIGIQNLDLIDKVKGSNTSARV